jgi:hypothetical protein
MTDAGGAGGWAWELKRNLATGATKATKPSRTKPEMSVERMVPASCRLLADWFSIGWD